VIVVVRCVRRRRISAGARRPGRPGFWGVRGGDGEIGVREHRQGDVPVPGVETADLVVVQAGLVFGRSKSSAFVRDHSRPFVTEPIKSATASSRMGPLQTDIYLLALVTVSRWGHFRPTWWGQLKPS
jgi:hypothetical protein